MSEMRKRAEELAKTHLQHTEFRNNLLDYPKESLIAFYEAVAEQIRLEDAKAVCSYCRSPHALPAEWNEKYRGWYHKESSAATVEQAEKTMAPCAAAAIHELRRKEVKCTCLRDGSVKCQFPHPCRRCYSYHPGVSCYWHNQGKTPADKRGDGRTFDLSDGRKGCNECCTGDRCDDPTHYDRDNCPYCLGSNLPFREGR